METLNLDLLPEEAKKQVIDYYNEIVRKTNMKKDNYQQKDVQETLLLSENSLKKDWLSPEEDEAWQNL